MIYTESLDLFIKYDGIIEDIADKIEELLGVELKKENDEFGDKYNFYFLNVEFFIRSDHEMENDGEMNFEDYNYMLSIIKLRNGLKYKDFYNYMCEQIARYLAEKLSKELNSDIMLTANVQKIISKISPFAQYV